MYIEMTFEQALSQIITYGEQIDMAYLVLAKQPCLDVLPLRATKQHLKHTLNKFMNHEIDDDDLTLWATIIDNQQAIDSFEIEDFLYALNNSELMGEINQASIEKMIRLL